MNKFLFLFSLLLASLSHAATPQQQLNTLFDSDWQWSMRNAPEFATAVGDNRYNDRLSDASLAASLAGNTHQQQMLLQAKRIDRSKLSGQDLLSYDLFIYEKQKNIQAAKFYPYNPEPISQLSGVQFEFPQLVAQTPFSTVKDYRNYLGRLRALPKYVDGVIAQLQQGVKSGWVAPKVTMSVVPDNCRNLSPSSTAVPWLSRSRTCRRRSRRRSAQAWRVKANACCIKAWRRLSASWRRISAAAICQLAATA
ncbi:hypothetical protein CFter6_1417 [Collimonas fungivorans]|uniref:DUF885 domain-containing protein n=1 Tax=Collimonas fungivorans TaxID=158899 RepID=A0A127P8P0_9BURK|nr:hypothetical protein CFter6_1417 [Collimonas fungivorans]